jgi:amino acid transporter
MIVLTRYLFRIRSDTPPTDWQLKGAAVGVYTVAVLRKTDPSLRRRRCWPIAELTIVVVAHTKSSYWLSNGIGAIKLMTLVFISVTGLVVLGGHTSLPDPHANFVDSFRGTVTPYGVTNALYKIIYSYAGFTQAFNVVNEVKVSRMLTRYLNCRG